MELSDGLIVNKKLSNAVWWVGHNGIPLTASSFPLFSTGIICAASIRVSIAISQQEQTVPYLLSTFFLNFGFL